MIGDINCLAVNQPPNILSFLTLALLRVDAVRIDVHVLGSTFLLIRIRLSASPFFPELLLGVFVSAKALVLGKDGFLSSLDVRFAFNQSFERCRLIF
jgi:hypothetical protein